MEVEVQHREVRPVEAVQGQDTTQFVNRVTSLPVVASTIGQVWELYSRCKESNELVKYSLESAENGVKYISNSAAPVIHKLEKPISTVNSIACSQLDRLEEHYPIITKPTDEVLSETKNLCAAKIKPSVDKVTVLGQYANEKYSNVKDYSRNKVADVTNYSTEKMNLVKDKSYEALNMVKDTSYEKLNAVLTSPYGQTLTNKWDVALNYAENYVDTYLPEKDHHQEEPKQEVDEAVVKSKPVLIYDKARHRLYQAAMSKMQDVQLRSKETLDRLSFTVNLIDYAKLDMDTVNNQISSTLSAAKDKTHYWWDEIRKEEEPETDPAVTPTYETQAIYVARNLAKKLRQGLYSLNDIVVPDHLLDRINSAKQFSSDLTWSFMKATKLDDLSASVMTRAKEQVAYIQDTMCYIANQAVASWPLKEVLPNITVDELVISDGEDNNDNNAHVDAEENNDNAHVDAEEID